MPIPTTAQTAPPTIREYLGRCDDQERLVTWWQRDAPSDPHEAHWVITYDGRTRNFCVVSFPVVVSHWSHQIQGGSYDVRGIEAQLRLGLWQAPESCRRVTEEFARSLGDPAKPAP